MKFNSSQDQLNWLLNHPHDKLYDQWGNYYVLADTGNYLEYHHYEIDYDEDGNDISFWDYDLENFADFLDDNGKPLDLDT